jgi:hypothetical protein
MAVAVGVGHCRDWSIGRLSRFVVDGGGDRREAGLDVRPVRGHPNHDVGDAHCPEIGRHLSRVVAWLKGIAELVRFDGRVAVPSYDCAAVIGPRRGVLSVVTRVLAIVCAIASATLGAYCVMLVYAAATFEHDSLPGPAVLYMVAVAVGLAAALFGGLSHLLWRVNKRRVASDQPAGRFGREE